MGTYNQLTTTLKCPRCGREASVVVDLYFGFRDQLDYTIGETYRWTKSPLVKNGGRPPNGTMSGEGYTECPHCAKDFFVVVNVKNDKFESAEPDPEKKPFIGD